MPLTGIDFKPGIVKDITTYSAGKVGPYWTDGDKVRFVNGLPEKIGGWAKYSSESFLGKCRALKAWMHLIIQSTWALEQAKNTI